MLAFSRITSILLFVLSLSFLTCAAPAPKSNDLAIREGVRTDVDLLVAACVDVRAKVVAHAGVMVKLDDPVKIKDSVKLVVKDINVFGDLVVKIKGIKVDAKVQAEIAVHLAVILKAVIKICVHLIAKLGLTVALDVIATLQGAFKSVLDSLEVCISGFSAVFVKLITEVELKALADVHLDAIVKLCLQIRTKLGLNINLVGLGVSL